MVVFGNGEFNISHKRSGLAGERNRQVGCGWFRGACTVKRFIFLLLIFIPLSLLYKWLESYFDGSWWAVLIFFVVLVVGRFGLYLYRAGKGSVTGIWMIEGSSGGLLKVP